MKFMTLCGDLIRLTYQHITGWYLLLDIGLEVMAMALLFGWYFALLSQPTLAVLFGLYLPLWLWAAAVALAKPEWVFRNKRQYRNEVNGLVGKYMEERHAQCT